MLTYRLNRLESLIHNSELPTQKVWVRGPEEEIIVTIGCDTLQNGSIESRVRSSCPLNKLAELELQVDGEVSCLSDRYQSRFGIRANISFLIM